MYTKNSNGTKIDPCGTPHFLSFIMTEQVNTPVILQTCIWEELNLNVDWGTRNSEGHFSLSSSPAHHSPIILSLVVYHVRQTASQNKPQKKANPFQNQGHLRFTIYMLHITPSFFYPKWLFFSVDILKSLLKYC